MGGPLQIIRYIHNAFLKDFTDLEESTKSLSYDGEGDIVRLTARFRRLRSYLAAHEESEEQVLFPALEQRFRYSSAAYAFDHDYHLGFYDGIEDLFEALERSNGLADAYTLRRLYRESVALSAVMAEHIAKENELLLPVFERDFSMEEQAALFGEMMGHPFPPDIDPGEAARWAFAAQNADNRAGFLRDYIALMPPEQRPGLVALLSGGVSAAEWGDVLRRVPELASVAGPSIAAEGELR